MLLTQMRQHLLIFILILFLSINFGYTQSTLTEFHASNIEIIPNFVVINSTSITDFICINHESNGAKLEANISKSVPFNQIALSTSLLNTTAMRIRLKSNNYVGIFHLLCYSSGEQTKGNRADVIVKAAPGVLQLVERCRVYDRQYIKCIIQAPIIATAIQNGYPPKFEFNEITYSSDRDRTAYLTRVEFVKNESTNRNLTFKWKPTIDGEFPNGVRMNIKAILPHFDNSSYYFDMTPVFRIKPKFILKVLSSSEIQIELTPISPPAFCEKSIVPQLSSNINQTWTNIVPERNIILIKDLLSGSNYRVCIKCRQVYTDPDGLEECQEIKTLSKISDVFNSKHLFIFIIMPVIILAIVIGFVVSYLCKRQKIKSIPDGLSIITLNRDSPNHYVLAPTPPTRSNLSIFNDSQVSVPLVGGDDIDNDDDDPINDEQQTAYLPIATPECVVDACFPKILPLPESESNS